MNMADRAIREDDRAAALVTTTPEPIRCPTLSTRTVENPVDKPVETGCDSWLGGVDADLPVFWTLRSVRIPVGVRSAGHGKRTERRLSPEQR